MHCWHTIERKELPDPEYIAPYIETGYRPPNKPWSYYFWSIFHLNNETCNIWTHLIPGVWILYKTTTLFMTYDLINDPYLQPMGAGLLGMSSVFLGSTFAHWFCDKSRAWHYLCFYFDYMGISLYGLGATFLTHNFCVRDPYLHHFLFDYTIYVTTALALIENFTFIYCKTEYGMCTISKVMRVLTNGSQYLWFTIPLVARMLAERGTTDPNLHLHKTHFILYVVSAFVFKLHIPERWYPRKYDIFGHSHQFFHVGIASIAYLTVQAMLKDVELHSVYSAHPTIPYPYHVLGGVVLIDLIVVALFRTRLKYKLDTEDKLRKDGKIHSEYGNIHKHTDGKTHNQSEDVVHKYKDTQIHKQNINTVKHKENHKNNNKPKKT